FGVVLVVLVRKHPAGVRPPEPALPGRVDVELLIGIAMMNPVESRPPEHSFLPRGLRKHRHQKLCAASELEAAVAEVTVVASGNAERAHGITRREPDEAFQGE